MTCKFRLLVASALMLAMIPLGAELQQDTGGKQPGGQAPDKQAGSAQHKTDQAATKKQTKKPSGAVVGKAKGQVHRPAGPVQPKDPWDELKLDPKVRIKLSLRGANIDNVVAKLQEASHVTIVKDPALLGPVTVASADPVSLSEMFHIFNSMLKLKGFELKRDGKILIISHSGQQAAPAPMPMPMMAQMQPQMNQNDAVVRFYSLQYANANQVARAINEVFQNAPANPNQGPQIFFPGQPQPQQPHAGPTVHASYEEYSNLVIVNAPSAQQDQVAALIKAIDKRQSEPVHAKTYKLKYATATDILPAVQNILQANMGKGRGAKEEQSNPFGFFFFGFNQQQNQNLAVADARTNAIIVTGPDDLIEVADQIILDLDTPMPFTGTTFVFKLENARADVIANLLTAAFGQRQGSQSNQNQNRPITPTNNTFTNTTSASRNSSSAMAKRQQQSASVPVALQDPNASSGELQTNVATSQFFGMFGQDGGRNRNSNGQTVGHDPMGRVIGVHDLTGQVTAIADANTNSVIIVTSPDNADLVRDLLQELDNTPEQVMIQTIIVEVTLTKASQFGLEYQFAQTKAFGSTGVTGSATQGFGLQGQNPPLQGFSYTLSGGDLNAFFNMLQTDTKFQVLSTPKIFTANNMEAQINISQSIPYIVSTFENTDGTFSYNYAFQDVGIVLTVTPHITSNGHVTMDVLQTANDLQGYTTFNAPIVNQREAETTMEAKDGDTVILGGMISNQVTSTVNKLPLLGDIPVLGELFRSTQKSQTKTELLVFMTPKIVRDPAEAKKLKDEAVSEVSSGARGLVKQQAQDQSGKSKGTGN